MPVPDRLKDHMPRFLALMLLSAAVFSLSAQPAATSPDYFELKVRPILANNCYACHAGTQMGGLRLDNRDDLMKGGTRGAAVVPGDPDKSPLIAAVRQTDARLKMPMGGKLKDADIEALVAWVKAGAVWPAGSAPVAAAAPASTGGRYVIAPERKKFWSLLPLHEPAPPAVKNAKWPQTSIDRFVLAKLESENLKPVRAAGRRDLIRRASLDLTGLPPTPAEIEAFEKDQSPDAFAKVVDRLLASPHYGERWGREWLDVARFGEDDYRSLNPFPRGFYPYPNAYLYRDWVIQAVNDDMPYDLFVKAQIAGDLLEPKLRAKMLPATGFLGLGPWYFDNGAVEVTRADERHDRVDVVTRGFLGLTVACARCHDHKYDPIPTADYYSLAGVFASTEYHEYPRVPQSVLESYKKTEAEVEKKQKILQEMQTNQATHLGEALALKTATYLEGVWDVTGPQKKERANVVEQRKLDYELLERWIAYMGKPTDKYHTKEGWQAFVKKGGTAQEAKKLAEEFQEKVVKVMLERRDLNEENEIISDQALPGTKKKKRANKPNEFITNDDFCPNCGLRLKNMAEEDNAFWTEIFQRELSDSDDPTAMMAMGIRQAKPGVLLFRGWGLESRVGAAAREEMTAMRADIEALQKKLQPPYPFVHGVKDAEKPVNLPISLRGSPYNLGPEEPRHFLSMLSEADPKPFEHGSGRLDLAEAIMKQPIAIRVIVNRIWRGHFGTGIVDTPSNFGMTGERPTNPELLEYLASSFVRNGLSFKKLHRDIMLSTVYQLSTEDDTANTAKDSGNRFYWRANRKRLEAEQLRDAVLLTSGNLDNAMGGPSADLTPAFTRRTVYGKVSRYKLDEYLQLFDFPTPQISAEKRFTTTVPLQRLFLMNSDFMQIEAEEFAKRVAGEPDNRARIRKAYLLAYGRAPSEQEIKLGLEYLRAEPLREYEEDKSKPKEEGGPKRRGPRTDATADAPPEGEGAAGGVENAGMGMGMGMMGGMKRGPGGPPVPEIKYDPTAWGRYVKILLSSSEFLFVN
jgi:cytochrome c553